MHISEIHIRQIGHSEPRGQDDLIHRLIPVLSVRDEEAGDGVACEDNLPGQSHEGFDEGEIESQSLLEAEGRLGVGRDDRGGQLDEAFFGDEEPAQTVARVVEMRGLLVPRETVLCARRFKMKRGVSRRIAATLLGLSLFGTRDKLVERVRVYLVGERRRLVVERARAVKTRRVGFLQTQRLTQEGVWSALFPKTQRLLANRPSQETGAR